jgi:hypothetical protein
MSERTKGISLRKKKGDKKKNAPAISAPRQISAPMPAGAGVGGATLSSSGRPSTESSQSRNREDAPRQKPQRADKTADLVKRRYSQKITTLPSDFLNGPMPDMPQIPSQFRQQGQPQDGRPATSGEGRGLRVDMALLRDPNLRAEQCTRQCVTSVGPPADIICRRIFNPSRRLRRRDPTLPRRTAQDKAPHLRRPPDQRIPE